MKQVIFGLLAGEKLASGLLMTVIRFVLPSKDKVLKRLLLLFWEAMPKHGPDGSLLPEMILVCNNLRNDLQHPNEYVRGITLRFLCKLREPELLEPLIPSICANLSHTHAYVRRNAVMTLMAIFKAYPTMAPDAPELVLDMLATEADASCRRNAFTMLCNCDRARAVAYLGTVLDQVVNFGDIMQFVVVDLVQKVVATSTPAERSKYIRCVYTLLQSPSPAVQYEAAGTLLALTGATIAVKASASVYIKLLCTQSDNNVKMIVLDRLHDVKKRHPKEMQDLLLDVLRALQSPNMDIRRKTLDLALELVSPKNIDEVVLVLKKEIGRTQSEEEEYAHDYRQLLIDCIHKCAFKFPDVANSVVMVLMDFVGDKNAATALNVVLFVRDMCHSYPALRPTVMQRLLDSLYAIQSGKVYRAALWIIGEYAQSMEEVDASLTAIKAALGDPPFIPATAADTATDADAAGEGSDTPAPPVASTGSSATRVLADGTYATQSALSDAPAAAAATASGSGPAADMPHLRAFLMQGNFFVSTVLASTLTKLALRTLQLSSEAVVCNSIRAEVMLVVTAILRLGHSSHVPRPLEPDSEQRLHQCLRVLALPDDAATNVFLQQTRASFDHMLAQQAAVAKAQSADDGNAATTTQPDDLIHIRQLQPSTSHGHMDGSAAAADADLSVLDDADADMSTKLRRIVQLTGYSDPVYAEAYVNVHQYDVTLEVLIINQTNDTLQNVCLELATLGDLKLVERPHNLTLGPLGQQQLKANIKVSSTETGIIFGNIVYDVAGAASYAADTNCVILNEIHIDIMDYMTPGSCTEAEFRDYWVSFEWENKVAVNTKFTELNPFLDHILRSTNMSCLTPRSELQSESGFLAANLYAKSVFGEVVLANLSVERVVDGDTVRLVGATRVRCHNQAGCLSMGDTLTTAMATTSSKK